jgi:hypothetical protein
MMRFVSADESFWPSHLQTTQISEENRIQVDPMPDTEQLVRVVVERGNN